MLFDDMAVVGNAADVVGTKLGGSIDSHQVVLRINSYDVKSRPVDTGMRVDIVSLCFARFVVENALPFSSSQHMKVDHLMTPYPVGYHNMELVSAYMRRIGKRVDDLNFWIDGDGFWKEVGKYAERSDLYLGLDSERARIRPTTGLLSYLYIRRMRPNAKITLYGFGLRNEKENPDRFDMSAVKMWEYHDLALERSILQEEAKSGHCIIG